MMAQQYRSFMRVALWAFHDAPLEILRLLSALV